MWLSQAFSLRKAYAGYEGPALNACQGQGAVTCEDIGWVNNTIDTATLSAFCGPVSGLNNCTVETWYNEALNQASDTNGVDAGIDATAISTTTRPTIAWSGCGTTAITVCIATSPTNYFARRRGHGRRRLYDVGGGDAHRRHDEPQRDPVLGLDPGDLYWLCRFGQYLHRQRHPGRGASTVACNDNVVHSITVDAHTSPSASTITYVDGTAGTANTSTIGYSGRGSASARPAPGSIPAPVN